MNIQGKLISTLLLTSVLPFGILASLVGAGGLTSMAGISAIIVLLIGLLVSYVVYLSLAKQVTSIKQTLRQIADGNLEARAEKVTGDQLGSVALALNNMCDKNLNLVLSNAAQTQVQQSIQLLNREIENIAAGDLTIAADVRKDITGQIASSVNNMTEQLRSIVNQVKLATDQVTDSANDIRNSSNDLSEESDQQAGQIRKASDNLLDMTQSFQEVAALSEESVQVAVEARKTASDGLKAVTDTVEGMQRIRAQVQNTSKRIKRLGESSQQIGDIVQLISDIADRTSILALNASIQAAMAGDAGHGFAVVAEEVERLAERSASASEQIAKLIRGIQNETGEVMSDMEESTREVVTGSQLATQAGETLFEIDSVSNQLVELIECVSDSTRSQAEKANRIAANMADISSSTRQSAEKNRQATESVGRLTKMADLLRDSVSRFKVGASATSLQSAATISKQPAKQPNQSSANNLLPEDRLKQQVEELTKAAREKSETPGSKPPASPLKRQQTQTLKLD